MDITITLTESQAKAMQFICVSIRNWIDNAVQVRATNAIDEIVKLFIEYALVNNITIPPSKDDIVTQAYALGVIKTAEERNEESLSNMQSGI